MMLVSTSQLLVLPAWREPHQASLSFPLHTPVPPLLLPHPHLRRLHLALLPFAEALLQVQDLFRSFLSFRYRPGPDRRRCLWAKISFAAATAYSICLSFAYPVALYAPLSYLFALCFPHLTQSYLHRQQ